MWLYGTLFLAPCLDLLGLYGGFLCAPSTRLGKSPQRYKKVVISHVKERCLSAPKRKTTCSQQNSFSTGNLHRPTNCFLFRYGNLEIGHIVIDEDKLRHFATSVISSLVAIQLVYMVNIRIAHLKNAGTWSTTAAWSLPLPSFAVSV